MNLTMIKIEDVVRKFSFNPLNQVYRLNGISGCIWLWQRLASFNPLNQVYRLNENGNVIKLEGQLEF